MRYLVLVCLLCTSAFAEPKPVKPVAAKPVKVEKADALDAANLRIALLEAKLAELEAALKKAAWERKAMELAYKYHLDPSKGDGWDETTLVIRRSTGK